VVQVPQATAIIARSSTVFGCVEFGLAARYQTLQTTAVALKTKPANVQQRSACREAANYRRLATTGVCPSSSATTTGYRLQLQAFGQELQAFGNYRRLSFKQCNYNGVQTATTGVWSRTGCTFSNGAGQAAATGLGYYGSRLQLQAWRCSTAG
jgi:hypothetical protein